MESIQPETIKEALVKVGDDIYSKSGQRTELRGQRKVDGLSSGERQLDFILPERLS